MGMARAQQEGLGRKAHHASCHVAWCHLHITPHNTQWAHELSSSTSSMQNHMAITNCGGLFCHVPHVPLVQATSLDAVFLHCAASITAARKPHIRGH